ncbi:MAG: PQQ-binding-like beta-propeller repeat protein [Armatimonadota bacterium]
MDYRTRWQQKRRRRQFIRLTAIPALIICIILVVYGVRLLFGAGARWSYQGPADNLAIPSTRGNLIVGVFSEGSVQCLRLIDGQPVWENLFARPYRFVAPAVISAGTVVVGSDYDAIYGLDVTRGSQKWAVQADGSFRNTPLVVDDVVYLASTGGKVYALKIADGTMVHEPVDTGRPLSGRPALIDEVLVVPSSDGMVLGLDMQQGAIVWARRLPVSITTPVIKASPFAAVGSDDGREYVINAADGTVQMVSTLRGLVRTAACDEEYLYFADSEGWIRKVKLATGRSVWRRHVAQSLQDGPYRSGEMLYCLVGGDTVIAVSARDGSVVRRYGGFEGAVHLDVGSGFIAVGTCDGQIHAVELP